MPNHEAFPLELVPDYTVRSLAESLRAVFEQLKLDLPAHGPQRLADTLEATVRWALSYYESALERAGDSEYVRGLVNRLFSGVLRDLHDACTELVHPPGVGDFPYEVLPCAKDWLCKYGKFDRETTSVAFLPQWPYYPKILQRESPLKKIEMIERDFQLPSQPAFHEELERNPKRFPDLFHLISFPQAEGRNILFHPMFLHEFAHAIDWNCRLAEKVLDEVDVPVAISHSDKHRDSVEDWVREFLADLLATRLGGPSVALSLWQTSLVANVMDLNSETHPSSRLRLYVMIEHLERLGYVDPGNETAETALGDVLLSWCREIRVGSETDDADDEFRAVRDAIWPQVIRRRLHEVAEEHIKTDVFDAEFYGEVVPPLVDDLRRGRPPIPPEGDGSPLPSVFNAAWETALLHSDSPFFDHGSSDVSQSGQALRSISQLALKGIEAAYVVKHWPKDPVADSADDNTAGMPSDPPLSAGPAVLTHRSLKVKLKDDLFVKPLLEPGQLGDGSIDLRLGTHFIVTQPGDVSHFDPTKMREANIRRFQQQVSKSFGETFVLHPQRLVLGGTFEYIALPNDLAALVLSRSSYGRVGLIVATATFVHPGWKGCLTLELSNAADVPFELRCGAPIAQLVVFRADRLPTLPCAGAPGSAPFPTRPEFSLLGSDPNWKKLKEIAHWVQRL